jgi:hypothetical protein
MDEYEEQFYRCIPNLHIRELFGAGSREGFLVELFAIVPQYGSLRESRRFLGVLVISDTKGSGNRC